jgi:hypothetical protein
MIELQIWEMEEEAVTPLLPKSLKESRQGGWLKLW